MQFADVVANRRMVRAYETRPVPSEVLDRVLDLARRVPAAGNTQGLDLVVLEGEQTQRYWDASLPADRRDAFPWPRLLDAPVLIIPVSWPAAYVERYGEQDKARTGLGESEESWSVPYWYVDTAFSAMVAMLAAVDEGLGALFFGQFEHEGAVKNALNSEVVGRLERSRLATPPGRRQPGASSRTTASRPFNEVVHRGGW